MIGPTFVLAVLLAAPASTAWHVDDDAPGDPAPGDTSVSDPAEDGTPRHPFDAIQEAIDASVSGDIVLVADGLYTGEGNRDLDYGGRAITVFGVDGYEACIIDAGGCDPGELTEEHRGFHFHSAETADARLVGVTVRCGFVSTDPRGGGILCEDGASPTIVECRISSNISGADMPGHPCQNLARGGGLFSALGSPTLVRCLIDDNEVFGCLTGTGGGVDGTNITLEDCDLVGNRARAFDDGYGGGFCGTGTLTDCRILSNDAQGVNCTGRGGGVYTTNQLTLTRCLIEDNLASAGGGCGGGDQGHGGGGYGPMTMFDCVVRDNSTSALNGGTGGGVAHFTALYNCLITGNSTRYNGGGIFGDGDAFNCTIVGNELCAFPGCGPVSGGVDGANFDLFNCIVRDNVPGNVGGTGQIDYSNVGGGWPGTGNIDLDPLFIDAVGGDYRLGRGSPCIDAGDNSAVPGTITADLAGSPRFVDDPATPDTGAGTAPIVDMGAYEKLPCPDGNGDGEVDVDDLNLVILGWGTDDPAADHDGNGIVDVNDLIAVITAWGPCEPPAG